MPTHITRTRSVDAAQWDGTEQAANLIDSIVGMGRFRPFGEELLYVSEHSTRARLCPGDWVIRAADGHISRMDAETFAETCQAVPDLDPKEVEELAENIADALGSVVFSGHDQEREPTRNVFRAAATAALGIIGGAESDAR